MTSPRTLRSASRLRGFSLLEIAIVLVVGGLLVGGVVAGRHLMNSAKTTSVVTEAEEVQRAVAQFMNSYNALPGDMNNAADRLGAFPGGGIATVNGDGDGRIESPNNGSGVDEGRALWQHLALAGLIKGQYNGATNTPGQGVRASKFGKDVGMEVTLEPVSGEVLIKYSRVEGGASDRGFMTPEEAQRLDKEYDDGNPITGNIRAADGTGGTCLTGTNYDTAQRGRGCSLSLLANQLNQNIADTGGTDDSDVGNDPGSASPVNCPGGIAVGSRLGPLACEGGQTGTYYKICREGGSFEIDTVDYTCTYDPCTAQVFLDRRGKSVRYPVSNIGSVVAGTCWNTGTNAAHQYLGGYGNNGQYQQADPQTVPSLTCRNPGGTEGWHATGGTSTQAMAGYCDTICRYAQITAANVDVTDVSGSAFLQGKQITPHSRQVNINCKTGYSDSTLTEATENQTLTCQTTEGAGYTASTLNCQADCSIAGTSGWNASRMNYTITPADNTANIRHGATSTVTCKAGYGHGNGVSNTVTVACNNGTRTIRVNGVVSASLPSCYTNCGAVPSFAPSATAAAPTNYLHGITTTVSCAAGYGGHVSNPNPTTTIRCNDGTWVNHGTGAAPTAPTCYSKCGTTFHGGTESCSPSGCSCGVASQGSKTCSNGSLTACTGGSCKTCAPTWVTIASYWCSDGCGSSSQTPYAPETQRMVFPTSNVRYCTYWPCNPDQVFWASSNIVNMPMWEWWVPGGVTGWVLYQKKQ